MKKWALVTGATAGIGESFTRLLAALAGRAVIDASTRAVAPATTMALRNMKTSIRYLAMVPREF